MGWGHGILLAEMEIKSHDSFLCGECFVFIRCRCSTTLRSCQPLHTHTASRRCAKAFFQERGSTGVESSLLGLRPSKEVLDPHPHGGKASLLDLKLKVTPPQRTVAVLINVTPLCSRRLIPRKARLTRLAGKQPKAGRRGERKAHCPPASLNHAPSQ